MRASVVAWLVLAISALGACDQKTQPAPASTGQQTAPGSHSDTPTSAGDPSPAPAPELVVAIPEGWKLVQGTEKRRVLAKTDPSTGKTQLTVIVTRSSFVPSSETARRANAEQFAPRVGEWELTGQPVTKKLTGITVPAYESVWRGTHKKSSSPHVVLTIALYHSNAAVTLLGMCVDDEQAEGNLDMMRRVVDGVSLK